MKEVIQELINNYEQYLKLLSCDQRTDDAMPRQKFDGVSQTYEKVIADLKKIVQDN